MMQRAPTFWLTFTNVVCGLLICLAVLYVAFGPVWERLAKLRTRRGYEAELDHDMRELFGEPSRPCDGARREWPARFRLRLRRMWRRVVRPR